MEGFVYRSMVGFVYRNIEGFVYRNVEGFVYRNTVFMLVMLSARSAVSSAYVRFVMFLPPILIPMSSGFGQVKIMKELILINRKLI
jgi:hypothetical protein